MRLDYLQVKNFKGFEEHNFHFHPNFNLIVGRNGTGKTSALDAIAVAIGSWFLGVRGEDTRHIRPSEILLKNTGADRGNNPTESRFEQQFPCEVYAEGDVLGEHMKWKRALNSPSGRTTYGEAATIKKMGVKADNAVRAGEDVQLPLICYYGTGRLWLESKEAFLVQGYEKLAKKKDLSRLAGYRYSIDPKLSVAQFTNWMARQDWLTYQNKKPSDHYETVKTAIISCVENAIDIEFDPKIGEVVVTFQDFSRPFSLLSDGQRCILAVIGDLAQKAVTLNPQLGVQVLNETSGIVMIDELDLHLHPLWQRHVIEDLRRVFPKIQFICTTHSPFLIQALRSAQELVMLDGEPLSNVDHLSIETIAQSLQGVENTETSLRYERDKAFAKTQLETMQEAAILNTEEKRRVANKLRTQLERYSDDPAFQAFLEMQRVADLGE